MKNNLFVCLATFFLFFSLVVSTTARVVFEDDFDDSSLTNSQWMIYDPDPTTTPALSFIPITDSYSGDMGYHVDTFDYSQEDEFHGHTIIFAQNGQSYDSRNLTISTLIRFDPPAVNPYSSAGGGEIIFATSPGNSINIGLQLDYEPPAIELEFDLQESISGTTNYLIRNDLTGKLDYNIFYQLSVHIDSNGYFNILVTNYETGEELVNISNFEPNVHFEEFMVGLWFAGIVTLNNFSLLSVDDSSSDFINQIYFNAAFYLQKYPDLQQAFGNDHAAALSHWISNGIAEGRSGSPYFDVDYYLEQYSDLQAVFGNNYIAAFDHWVNYGTYEGRTGSPNFNPVFYLQQYSDLQAAFGDNYNLAFIHWVNSGIYEGRQGSTNFDPVYYLQQYPDLQQAFGDDYHSAFKHWILYGESEGRTGVSP